MNRSSNRDNRFNKHSNSSNNKKTKNGTIARSRPKLVKKKNFKIFSNFPEKN